MGNRIKSGISPKMPEIGKIKIGMKNQQSKPTKAGGAFNPPVKLDHFLIVKPERNADKVNYKIWDELQNKLGKNPTELKCILPFDNPELNFMTSFAYYDSRRCKCRGDGETAEMIFDRDGTPKNFIFVDNGPKEVKKGDKRKIVCNYETCPNAQPDAKGNYKCKPNGILRVIIPDSGYLNGFFAFRSTSWNTISFLTAALDEMFKQSNGVMAYLPAKLKTFQKYTESHGNVRVVTIDWDMDQVADMVQIVNKERSRRLELGIDVKQKERLAITSGALVDNDEPAEIAKEFYPENTIEHQEVKQKIDTDITERSSAILGDVKPEETKEKMIIGIPPEEKEEEKPEEGPGSLFS